MKKQLLSILLLLSAMPAQAMLSTLKKFRNPAFSRRINRVSLLRLRQLSRDSVGNAQAIVLHESETRNDDASAEKLNAMKAAKLFREQMRSQGLFLNQEQLRRQIQLVMELAEQQAEKKQSQMLALPAPEQVQPSENREESNQNVSEEEQDGDFGFNVLFGQEDQEVTPAAATTTFFGRNKGKLLVTGAITALGVALFAGYKYLTKKKKTADAKAEANKKKESNSKKKTRLA